MAFPAGDFEKGLVTKLAGVLFHFVVNLLNVSLLLIGHIKRPTANLTIVFVRNDARRRRLGNFVGNNGLKNFSGFQGSFTLGCPFGRKWMIRFNLRNLSNNFASRRGLTCSHIVPHFVWSRGVGAQNKVQQDL